VDVCRFLLPAAALANVGMTVNARALENTIRKMLSHPLAEVRDIGQTVKDVARAEVPTLVKYAEAVPYLVETSRDFGSAVRLEAAGHETVSGGDWCRLVQYDPAAERSVLAAVLYRFGEGSFDEARQRVDSLTETERAELAAALLRRLGSFDEPLRELEHAEYTFDLVMDQGAYAEFKRHRMMTQTPQRLTARLGYAIPRRIVEAGCRAEYEAAMQRAAETYEKLRAFDPLVAQYIVPNGYRRRVLARFNLRSAWHFCRLRSAPNAHFSIRRIAERVAEEIRRVHPLLGGYMSLPEETWQQVEADHFTQ
jgi:thymidylate synthase ThyX